MEYRINLNRLEEGRIAFLHDDKAYSGVVKTAAKVAKDIEHVFGARPDVICAKRDDINASFIKEAFMSSLSAHITSGLAPNTCSISLATFPAVFITPL